MQPPPQVDIIFDGGAQKNCDILAGEELGRGTMRGGRQIHRSRVTEFFFYICLLS